MLAFKTINSCLCIILKKNDNGDNEVYKPCNIVVLRQCEKPQHEFRRHDRLRTGNKVAYFSFPRVLSFRNVSAEAYCRKKTY